MNFKKTRIALLIAGLGVGGAHAATYTLWEGGTGGTYLPTNVSYTNSFDANLLFNVGMDPISNATLTLTLVGQEQPVSSGITTQMTASGSYSSYYHGSGTWQATDTTMHYTDALDSVKVLIGGNGNQTATGADTSGAYGSSAVTSTDPVIVPQGGTHQEDHGYSVSYQCGFLGSGICSYWQPVWVTVPYDYNVQVAENRSLTETNGYKGPFTVVTNLDNTSLGLLESTGLLRYGFTVTGGGVALDSATLSFDVGASTAPVPAPASYVLMLSGVGLLGFSANRKKSG